LAEGHQVTWAHDAADLLAGDICFYLSYDRIVDATILARHKNNLVVRASNLPKGRGWSPELGNHRFALKIEKLDI